LKNGVMVGPLKYRVKRFLLHWWKSASS
jgi:hypothetical protein